jgi:hypothetical protein
MRMRLLDRAALLGRGILAFRGHRGGGTGTWLAALAFGALLGIGPDAGAAMLTFDLGVEYSGGQQPAGTFTATFDDSFGGPNTVRLTLSATGPVGSERESVGLWLFNFDPDLDPTQLTFDAVDDTASVPNSITTGVDEFKAAGGGLFDIEFDFPPPAGHDSARFTVGEVVIYDITYTGPIDVSAFDFQSASLGGNGTHRSAAHVMRIGPADGSGWIGATPEPSTALLFGVGLVGLAGVGRRSR